MQDPTGKTNAGFGKHAGMASVLAASLRRVVGEEKTSEALTRWYSNGSGGCFCRIRPCGHPALWKHKDLFNVRVTDGFVTLLAAAVSASNGIKIGVLDLSCIILEMELAGYLQRDAVGGNICKRNTFTMNDITELGCCSLWHTGCARGLRHVAHKSSTLMETHLGTGLYSLCNMIHKNPFQLNLGNTQIGTMTLIQLAKVMWYNNTVRVLNLESQRSSYDKEETAIYHLAKMVRANRSLSELYLVSTAYQIVAHSSSPSISRITQRFVSLICEQIA